MTAPGPVFIGGLSHSGKTELRAILGAHPAICMTRGTRLWDHYYERFGRLSDTTNLERCLSAILRDEDVRRLQPDEGRIRREFLAGATTYPRLFGLIHSHHAERVGKARWGEQLGSIERFAAPIFEAFPGARMIHMVRDPRARYGEATARSAKPKHRGALGWETAKWLRSVALAERNARRYPEGYRVVRFESLAADPEPVVRDLCGFIGAAYTAEIAGAVAAVRFDARPPRGARDGLDAAFVDLYARPELLAFGYPVRRAPLAPRDRLPFLLKEWPLNRAAMTAWKVFGARAPKQRVVR